MQINVKLNWKWLIAPIIQILCSGEYKLRIYIYIYWSYEFKRYLKILSPDMYYNMFMTFEKIIILTYLLLVTYLMLTLYVQ